VTAVRGTSNGNANGSAADRAARRTWLIETYRADVDVLIWENEVRGLTLVTEATSGWPSDPLPACRCYRCGRLLIDATAAGLDPLAPDVAAFHVTVDRIIPGRDGGTYRRNNIRPACGACNSETGGKLRKRARR
jgi:hypothetical protein